jgi:hypothetical protein
VLKWDGTRAVASASQFGPVSANPVVGHTYKLSARGRGSLPVRRLSSLDLFGSDDTPAGANSHDELVDRVSDFALMQSATMVSFALLPTERHVESAESWLCNVAAKQMIPPAMVLGVSDELVAARLQAFIDLALAPTVSSARRFQTPKPLVVSLGYSTTGLGNAGGLSHIQWRLELAHVLVLRDLLDRGTSVLSLCATQVWLSNPMPYVYSAITESVVAGEDGCMPDVVTSVTVEGDIAGGLFYSRASFATRQVWSDVTSTIFAAYRRSLPLLSQPPDLACALREAITKTGRPRQDFASVKRALLDRELFVDGSWYDAGEASPYRSAKSRVPVVSNVDDSATGSTGPLEWRAVAKARGHWFVTASMQCDTSAVWAATLNGSAAWSSGSDNVA